LGLQKEAQSNKNQVFSMFLKKVMLIFLIFGPFPGIAKIGVHISQLLEDTGSFLTYRSPE
jgi:hypothetical protein